MTALSVCNQKVPAIFLPIPSLINMKFCKLNKSDGKKLKKKNCSFSKVKLHILKSGLKHCLVNVNTSVLLRALSFADNEGKAIVMSGLEGEKRKDSDSDGCQLKINNPE